MQRLLTKFVHQTLCHDRTDTMHKTRAKIGCDSLAGDRSDKLIVFKFILAAILAAVHPLPMEAQTLTICEP